jgi:hypothetical protein
MLILAPLPGNAFAEFAQTDITVDLSKLETARAWDRQWGRDSERVDRILRVAGVTDEMIAAQALK